MNDINFLVHHGSIIIEKGADVTLFIKSLFLLFNNNPLMLILFASMTIRGHVNVVNLH